MSVSKRKMGWEARLPDRYGKVTLGCRYPSEGAARRALGEAIELFEDGVTLERVLELVGCRRSMPNWEKGNGSSSRRYKKRKSSSKGKRKKRPSDLTRNRREMETRKGKKSVGPIWVSPYLWDLHRDAAAALGLPQQAYLEHIMREYGRTVMNMRSLLGEQAVPSTPVPEPPTPLPKVTLSDGRQVCGLCGGTAVIDTRMAPNKGELRALGWRGVRAVCPCGGEVEEKSDDS